MEIERINSGILGLDELLGGGIPRGSIILVAGHPGSGKTVFSAKFIYEGAVRWGEPGLYVSFAESEEDFKKYMKTLDLDFEPLKDRGLFKFLSLPTIIDSYTIEQSIEEILGIAKAMNAKRLVIDSITAVLKTLGPERTRALLHTALIPGFKRLGITALLIADLPYGSTTVGMGVEEFVVDGVLVFKMERERGMTRRLIEVRKMRGSRTLIMEIPFVIMPRDIIRLLIAAPLDSVVGFEEEVLSTGVEGLDELLGGGINRGAQVLLVGPSGSGKSLLALQMALNMASEGRRVLYLSFEESTEQLRRKIMRLGYGDPGSIPLSLVNINVTAHTYDSLIAFTLRLIDSKKPQVFVADGLGEVMKAGDERAFWASTTTIFNFLRREHITGIHTYAARYPEETVPLDTISDIIILLKYERKGDRYSRKIMVYKHRGRTTDTRISGMVIDGRGRIRVVKG
ncbi:MAG: AAA family ATPase [Desulfurococcales archaeon]|nr:AAA family ATPase [Desulfurococcales archaeon]